MKDNSHKELLDTFKKQGGFFNKNLIIKKDIKSGFGIISTDDIPPDTMLIDVPHNLLIPVDEVQSLTKFNNAFEQAFFKTINDNKDYLNFHPLMSNSQELEEINSVIRKNQNLYKNFSIKHKEFNSLTNEKKEIELLNLTRAIFLKKYNKKFFMPIMDFVNYHNDGLNYLTGENGNVYLKSKKKINKNEEILISYTHSTDAISFYFKHGFTDNSFNFFRIKKDELKLELNTISTFNKKYFSKEKNIYTFKENILFYNDTFSKNIFKFLEIFPSNQRQEMMIKILKMYKDTISMNSESQKLTNNSTIIKKFYKSIELYTNIIDNYLKLLKKKDEKN